MRIDLAFLRISLVLFRDIMVYRTIGWYQGYLYEREDDAFR